MNSLDPTDPSRTLAGVHTDGRNLRSEFEFESGSDDSASAPEGAQRSRQNTTESSELPEDAASFVMYKRMQAMMEAQIKKLRQEAREERYRLEEVIKEEKAKNDALRRMNRTLQANNPEAKIQADALRDQTRLAERRRRRCRALSQQIVRMNRAEKKPVVRGYTKLALEKMMSRSEPGGKVLMSMQSIADSGAKAAEQPDAQQAGSKRKWKLSKFAGKHVLVKLPSPFVSRLGEDGAYIGGLEANPKRLVAVVCNWNQHNLSISAVCRALAYELNMMQEETHVSAERHRGQAVSVRRSFPGNSSDKKLDVFGTYCEKTVARAIHAFHTTVDWWMSKEILSADGIHLAFDISTFTIFHHQSIYLFAFWVKESGKDAADNPMWTVTTKDCFLPSIAVGEKLTRRLRDTEGNDFDTSTTRAGATSFLLAGLSGIVLHPNVSVGVDGGGEGAGVDDPSSAGNSRANKNGLGSYRHEIFVTRAAFEQAMKKDGVLLSKIMDHYAVSDDVRPLLEKRDAPKTLVPVTKFNSCPGTLWIRERNDAYTRERPVWNDEKELVVLEIRVSMDSDPITCMALVKGGVAAVFQCLKHLGHTLALHASKLTMPHVRALASVNLAINNVWIFTRIKIVIEKIFELEGCGPLSPLQKEVSRRLRERNPKLFAEVQARYKPPHKFAKVSEACETRWGAVGEGSDDYSTRAPELRVGMVLTFSEGLDKNRADATVSVWSEEGFRHNGLIKMSPKIGRVVFRMNDPGFIFGTCLDAFFHMFVHGITLKMSSYNKESSSHVMGGVGSVLRSVHYFLTRGMWLIYPVNDKWCKAASLLIPGVLYTTKKSEVKNGWAMHYPLQWKALVTAKPRKGLLMLNPAAFLPRGEKGISTVQHLLGPAYKREMAGALTKVVDVIDAVSKLNLGDLRNVLPKGHIRNVCSGPQSNPHERKRVMVRAVATLAVQIAKDLVKQFDSVFKDPHMFLAGISSVDAVKVVRRSTNGCRPTDADGQESIFFVATDVALANAACLTGQMRELEQAYAPQLDDGEKLGDFMHGPLRTLFLDPNTQKELGEFRKARGVLLDSRWTEDGSYRRAPDDTEKGVRFRPRPCSAFPLLAAASLQSAAMPKTNQRVESGFSLASMAYRCYRRSQGPELNSDTIRKKNAENLGVMHVVQSQKFLNEFSRAVRFWRVFSDLISKAFKPNPCETEAKYNERMQADLPQRIQNGGTFQCTNIEDNTAESANALKRPDRNGGRKQNSRHREAAVDAGEMQPDAGLDSTRAQRRRRLPVMTSAAAPKRWTLDLLNKEKMDDLKDMCSVQGLVVNPSDGSRVKKADYVRALLAAEDSHLGSSDIESQAQGDDPELPVSGGYPSDMGNEDFGACPEAAEDSGPRESAGGSEPIDQGAPAPSAQGVSVGPAVPASAGTTDSVHDTSCDELADLQAYIRECEADGEDPFDPFNCNVDSFVKPSELEHFDRVMSAKVVDLEADNSESDSEDAPHAIPPRTEAIESVRKRGVGVWKRKYAEALAGSGAWKPCNIIGVPIQNKNKVARDNCQLGTLLRSVTLERIDEDHAGIQFTVNSTGRVFYLLRTPVGVELVRITQIYHPKTSEETVSPVWIEYYRVLAARDAIQVCDRADTNYQQYQTSEGKTIETSSSGSKQLEIERAEREQQGKSELYHWGDVLCTANATSLIGGVYWLTKSDESDWADAKTRKDILLAVQDKIPITDLQSMDRVVVGSGFSDSN